MHPGCGRNSSDTVSQDDHVLDRDLIGFRDVPDKNVDVLDHGHQVFG